MSLNVAIQMDAPERLSPKGDSTIIIAMEAQERRHSLSYYHHSSLQLLNNVLYADVAPITFRDPSTHADWFDLGEASRQSLHDVDVVLMRQDPPFDMHYITATHLLEHIHPDTLVVNDPFHVRNCPEKIFPILFSDYMPETLITASHDAILAFLEEHGDIIIKPLHGHGGYGIFRLRKDGDNTLSLLEMLEQQGEGAMMAQRFLPEVADGDRRIILIDGKVEGVLGRIPDEGEIRANFRVGGTAAEAALTPKQREICDVIGPELKKRGLIFVGLDVIGDWLTEINVTSPTGLRGVKDLYGTTPEASIWDAIESARA